MWPRLAAATPALLLAGLSVGCAADDARRVTITSDPPGATVRLTRIDPWDGSRRAVAVPDALTPLTVRLPFDRRETYEAEATRPGYLSETARIAYGPTGRDTGRADYRLALTRASGRSTQVVFEPGFTGQRWRLVPRVQVEPVYVLGEVEAGSIDAAAVRVTDNKDAEVDLRSVAASPTGDALLYQRVERRPPGPAGEPRFAGDVYLWTPDRPPAPVAADASSTRHTPAFGGYGDDAVYAADADGRNATLFRCSLDADGGADDGGGDPPTPLTRGEQLDWNPSVGLDRLAYTSLPPEVNARPQVWVAGIDGSGAQRVADGRSPRLSPDDRRLVYVTLDDAGVPGQLRVSAADGADPVELTDNVDHQVVDPAWSPDGRFVAFAADPLQRGDDGGVGAERHFDLFVVPADGSGPAVRLTSNRAHDSSPAWDRAGRSIYFRSNRGGVWNVWRVDVEPR